MVLELNPHRLIILQLALYIVLLTSINSCLCADVKIEANNGDTFKVVKVTDENNNRIFELHRKTKNNSIIVMWKSNSFKVDGLPFVPLELYPISAIHEKDGEISLLVKESEACVFIFRFPENASSTLPIVLGSIRPSYFSYPQLTQEIVFKNHNAVKFISKNPSEEYTVSFDAKGKILHHFSGMTSGVLLMGTKTSK